MALSFPNPTRSYDSKHHCVRFWGYDGTFEVSFLVEQNAFSRMNPGAPQDKSGILRIFDKYRDKKFLVLPGVFIGGAILELIRWSHRISESVASSLRAELDLTAADVNALPVVHI